MGALRMTYVRCAEDECWGVRLEAMRRTEGEEDLGSGNSRSCPMTFSLAYEHAQDDGYAAYTPYNQRGKIQTAGSS